MLDKDQLDADQYPEINVKLVSVREQSQKKGDTEFGWTVTIALTVHGKTVERECPASLMREDGRVTVEAVGAFKFTEFGIRPYSAFMGAVKNRDDFHVYAYLVADSKGAQN
jgi:polyisoprenoid-binding protein YceI